MNAFWVCKGVSLALLDESIIESMCKFFLSPKNVENGRRGVYTISCKGIQLRWMILLSYNLGNNEKKLFSESVTLSHQVNVV